MKRSTLFLLICIIAVCLGVLAQAQENAVLTQAKNLLGPLPGVIESKDNPVTPEKVELGRMLFYDTRISVDGTVSCFKCHWINLYATDGLKKSIGNNYKPNPRNAPTVFNAAGQISEHWIGNRTSVEDQAKQALIGPPSYGLASYEEAVKKIKAIKGYVPLFQKAFPGEKDPVSADNFGKAVGAFERTLVTPSGFDDFLKGNVKALTQKEQTGLKTFMDTGCSGCHNGSYVGGQMLQKFGLTQAYWNLTHSPEPDSGRYTVTKNAADIFVFKVPPLRNVAMTAPYFHDGSVDHLLDAVKIMAQLQLGKTLTDAQAEDIVTFLNSLTGQIPYEALKVPVLPTEE
jgi:cytochrome c peroxidase